jgi:hypothetical protein
MAITEQTISGQIGQPAACMIENKRSPGVKNAFDKAVAGFAAACEAARLWARGEPFHGTTTGFGAALCDPGDANLIAGRQAIHRCCGQHCV